MSYADCLVNALEGEDAVSKIFLLAFGVNERPLVANKPARRIFAEDMIKESWVVSKFFILGGYGSK